MFNKYVGELLQAIIDYIYACEDMQPPDPETTIEDISKTIRNFARDKF